jgi:hypothetical protein
MIAAQWNGVQPARLEGDGRNNVEDSSPVVLQARVVERSRTDTCQGRWP